VTMIECGEHSGDVEEAEHSHGAICIKTRVALDWRVSWFRGGETLPAKSTVRK
jgi:hypothetical protein